MNYKTRECLQKGQNKTKIIITGIQLSKKKSQTSVSVAERQYSTLKIFWTN